MEDPVFGGRKPATEVVVVGAGVGGLATAARLAKAGCRCVWSGVVSFCCHVCIACDADNGCAGFGAGS